MQWSICGLAVAFLTMMMVSCDAHAPPPMPAPPASCPVPMPVLCPLGLPDCSSHKPRCAAIMQCDSNSRKCQYFPDFAHGCDCYEGQRHACRSGCGSLSCNVTTNSVGVTTATWATTCSGC